MKINIKNNYNKNRIILTVMLWAVSFIGAHTLYAQLTTNLTSSLGVQYLNTGATGLTFTTATVASDGTIISRKLMDVGADCFLLTFNLADQGSVTSDLAVLNLGHSGNNSLFKIGITANKNGWYVERWYKSKYIRYRIYDNINYVGKYTVIVGKYFLGLANDEGTGWRFAPIFFGLDSDVGSYGYASIADEFLGNTTNYLTPTVSSSTINNLPVSAFYFKNNNGSTKMADLITALGAGSQNVVNARLWTEEVTTPTELETKNKGITLYPNPTQHSFQLEFALKVEAEVWYKIIDINGRTLQINRQRFEQGQHTWNIQPQDFIAKGIYFVEVQTNAWRKTLQLVIE